MQKILLEKLLSYEEGSNLDFKREIDLDSKRGKADFLVEVLGLANASRKPSYLVIGIEDKTRKAIGIPDEITEERIQKFLADHCRPPIHCIFEVLPYKRKRIGVLTILGESRPYVVKGEVGYQDEKGKQHKITDKDIFVRRGSTGDAATPDEIKEMALERQAGTEDMEDVVRKLDELSSDLYHINRNISRIIDRHDRERIVEYLFVGILAGIITGILQALGLNWYVAMFGIFLTSFWFCMFASVLKLIRFGWMRSIWVSIAISAGFIGVSYLLDNYFLSIIANLGPISYTLPIWSGVKGMSGGIVAAYFGRGEYDYD
jgi:hypothetical protein